MIGFLTVKDINNNICLIQYSCLDNNYVKLEIGYESHVFSKNVIKEL